MQTLLNRPSRAVQVAAALFPLVAFAVSARADIFQWEYVDPADPSQGKRQSTQRVWDGLGVTAGPGANLVGRDLTMAYLIGADLTNAKLGSKIESSGRLYVNPPASSSPNPARLGLPYSGPVKFIDFRDTRLADADFTGANVRGASFSRGFCPPDTLCNHYNAGGGITLEQLYSTASYQARDLRGINFTGNFLSGGKFTGQNLANTGFTVAYLTDADFTGADIKGATFDAILDGTGLKLEQLYSTATYQTHDLSGIGLSGNDLTDGNFAGFTLSSARFSGATLTDADFSGAVVQGASFDVYRYTFFGVTHDVGTGITLAQLYSTASYRARNLIGVGLARGNLAGANFAGQNLANARFTTATLTGADFSGATIRGASFAASEYQNGNYITGTGITLQQLYSTASYQAQDLSNIDLTDNNLNGGNFAGQLLINASLGSAILTGADFSGTDARGAYIVSDLNSAGAVTTNFIQPNGHINGLDLDNNRLLIVRNYRDYFGNPAQFPITVEQHFAIGSGGALRMKVDADAWDSTISFGPGIPVTLGGTLELTFADGVNLASQIGRTFDLFDWTGVDPTGDFAISSPYAWDLSNLYTTGDVTLTAIPEPCTLLLFSLGLVIFLPLCRVVRFNTHSVLRIKALLFPLVAFAASAQADIFQWEYINPADPSQGKRQSTMLAPDGLGVDAVPGASLYNRNLTMAYLIGADLTNVYGFQTNLTNADLSQANLTKADFSLGNVAGANFTNSVVRGAHFGQTGITLAQLYSTASYQAHDMSGIELGSNDFATGGNFVGQNLTKAFFARATLRDAQFENADLTDAYFGQAMLTGADFRKANLTNADFIRSNLTGAHFADQKLSSTNLSWTTLTDTDFINAEVRGTKFDIYVDSFGGRIGTGIALAQLYSTASYQAHDLTGIAVHANHLAGGNFAGQKLKNANFSGAIVTGGDFSHADFTDANFAGTTLTGANFTGAEVRGASFYVSYDHNAGRYLGGITLTQLYSTASYQAHDLTGIDLGGSNDLSGGNFAGQNLAKAKFYGAIVTDGDFRQANLTNVIFETARLSRANFSRQNLVNANFYTSTLEDANFTDAILTNADFTAAALGGANFTGAEVRGAAFDYTVDRGFTAPQLYSTASYQARNLKETRFANNDLSGWNFSGQDLSDATFTSSILSGADFTNAQVRGAGLLGATDNGFAASQLYSTASYQAHDLTEIDLGSNDLTGWNFFGQNLTRANFRASAIAAGDFRQANLTDADFAGATLTDAVFTGAQVRGATFSRIRTVQSCGSTVSGCPIFRSVGTGITPEQLYSTSSYQERDIRGVGGIVDVSIGETANLILPDGHVHGLDLNAGNSLTIRDYNGNPTPIPITVDEKFAIGPGGTLRMMLVSDAWDSTISFAPGIPVTLDGTLDLTFAPDVNLASQIGRTLHLFDWTGVNRTGAFDVSSPYAWDLSNLYNTGEVTLTAVPEVPCLALTAAGAFGLTFFRRRIR